MCSLKVIQQFNSIVRSLSMNLPKLRFVCQLPNAVSILPLGSYSVEPIGMETSHTVYYADVLIRIEL